MYRYIQSSKVDEDTTGIINQLKSIFNIFDIGQIDELHRGLMAGLDVSWYANPEFSVHQMSQIRQGLRAGIDVSKFADPKIDAFKMSEIRKQLTTSTEG